MRIQCNRGVVIGKGIYGLEGQILDVPEHEARILLRSKQVRIAPAPAADLEPPKKHEKDGGK